jgi:Zn ribbon nucleic-acid-binding protein
MISLTFESLLLLYLLLGGGVVLGLWFYCDRRDALRTRNRNHFIIFHCIKCGHIYTHDPDQPVVACPKCGFKNSRLRF